jgi:hypothetical protein
VRISHIERERGYKTSSKTNDSLATKRCASAKHLAAKVVDGNLVSTMDTRPNYRLTQILFQTINIFDISFARQESQKKKVDPVERERERGIGDRRI